MKKRCQILLVSILVILLVTPKINGATAIASSSKNGTSRIHTLTSQNYIEKEIPFEHKTNLCDSGPWELNKNSSGMIYAYEWDTYYSGTTDSFWVGLNKMKWSKDGELSYQTISLSNEFSHRITSGGYVWATKQDKYNNLFVAYKGIYAGKSNVHMLTVLNKKGTIVKDFVLDDVLKRYIPGGYVSISDIHITGTTIALLVYEDFGKQTSIQLYNWKTGKRLSTKKLSTMSYTIIGNYLYNVKSSDSANAINATNLDLSTYKLIKYSLDGKKVLWSQNLPKGEMEIDDAYYKYGYDTVGDMIYVCNRKGIYSADSSKKNSKFSLVMSANQSQYLSKHYTICGLSVINKDRFYLLSIEGADNEWPTNLAMYTRN